MKVLLGAAAAVLLMAVPAAAQTTPAASTCAALQPAPTLPDGAVADREAMEAANTAFMAWAEAYRTVLTCRRTEAEGIHAQWQARVSEYNAGAEQLNSTNSSWEAEVAEYNERNPRRSTSVRRPSQ